MTLKFRLTWHCSTHTVRAGQGRPEERPARVEDVEASYRRRKDLDAAAGKGGSVSSSCYQFKWLILRSFYLDLTEAVVEAGAPTAVHPAERPAAD